MTTNITEQSKQLFIELAKDAGNWNGQPLLDVSKEERGNVTQLKRSGLIKTEMAEGHVWVIFTDAGVEYAASLGVEYAASLGVEIIRR